MLSNCLNSRGWTININKIKTQTNDEKRREANYNIRSNIGYNFIVAAKETVDINLGLPIQSQIISFFSKFFIFLAFSTFSNLQPSS